MSLNEESHVNPQAYHSLFPATVHCNHFNRNADWITDTGAYAAAALRVAEQELTAAGGQAWHWLESVRALGRTPDATGNRKRKGVKPPAPPTKTEREARVAALNLNPSTEVVLQSREQFLFAAIPVDQEGQAIQGLQATWESNNKQVIFVRKNGEAIAGKPGEAIVTARAGNRHGSVRVTVVAGTNEGFGGKKKTHSTRSPKQNAVVTDNNNAPVSARTTSRRKRSLVGQLC